MSNWYYGSGTASTTYYNYTSYSGEDVRRESEKSANILETKSPAKTWSDVTKVGVDGQTWNVDEVVKFNSDGENKAGICRIVEFEPVRVVLRYVGHGEIINVPYRYIDKLSDKDFKKVKLEPNEAFRQRKKRRGIW